MSAGALIANTAAGVLLLGATVDDEGNQRTAFLEDQT
jgi:hypothetical protein